MGLFDDYVDPEQLPQQGGLLARLIALQQQRGQYYPDADEAPPLASPVPLPTAISCEIFRVTENRRQAGKTLFRSIKHCSQFAVVATRYLWLSIRMPEEDKLGRAPWLLPATPVRLLPTHRRIRFGRATLPGVHKVSV